MIEQDMKQLAKDVQHSHPELKCIFAERVLLPFRKFSPEIWVTKNAGPRELDIIFLGLLKHGVDTREEVASRLGVDSGEFIFAHLDILIREEYVNESADILTLTEKGKGFIDGSVLEERLELLPFSFVWGDMTSRIEENVKFAEGTYKKIKHGEYPGDENLTLALAECFNEMNKNVKFFDVAIRDFRWTFPEESKYAEYAAVFYARDSKDSLSRIDLRMHVRTPDARMSFVLCEELSKQASREPWLGKFEEIYNKYIESK